MRRALVWAALMAALAVGGCGRLGLGPPPAKSSPPEAPSAREDLRGYAGAAYSDFITREGMERFAPAALGYSPDEAEGFQVLMAGAAAELVSGGGAEALVFAGCAPSGCNEAIAVLAIDADTGSAFAGLRDREGSEILAPNARVEALLRLTSPSGRWDDPIRAATGAPE